MTEARKPYAIRLFGDPVLRKKAEPVKNIDGRLAELAEGMLEALNQAKGLGLAAPQVGRATALCIINLPALDERQKKPLVLVNPKVVLSQGTVVHQEGCLSFPELFAEVARPEKVGITGLDLDGRPVELEADQILARVFLHEIDHLEGVLFIDHLSHLKRQLLKRRLREITKQSKP